MAIKTINYDGCLICKYPIVIDDDYMWEDYEDYIWKDDDFCLEQSDFYPPPDDRVWESYIEDIEGGDNFADYCREFFQMLDEEEYWEV